MMLARLQPSPPPAFVGLCADCDRDDRRQAHAAAIAAAIAAAAAVAARAYIAIILERGVLRATFRKAPTSSERSGQRTSGSGARSFFIFVVVILFALFCLAFLLASFDCASE